MSERPQPWVRRKTRIFDSPSHDQYLEVRPSWIMPLEDKLEFDMRNANGGGQSIRLDPEDVADLIVWLQRWQESRA